MDVTPPENLYYYYPLTMVPAMYPYRTALVGLVRDTKMEAKFKHIVRGTSSFTNYERTALYRVNIRRAWYKHDIF